MDKAAEEREMHPDKINPGIAPASVRPVTDLPSG
jgi:hypothetical protein